MEQKNKSTLMPAHPITEDTLIFKSIFAFFGHTKEFHDVSGNEEKLHITFFDPLIRVCHELFKCIREEEFNKENSKYHWFSDEIGLGRFPKKFTGISNQLKKKSPNFTSKKSKVFPHCYAGMCTIAKDILSENYDLHHSTHVNIRRIVKLKENDSINVEQRKTLSMIVQTLRKYSDTSVPDWTVTYDQRRPIIKVDKTAEFLSGAELKKAQKKISGQYTVYRKAFLPPDEKKEFIKEHLTVKEHSNGLLFHFQNVVGPEEIPSTFNGVVVMPKGSTWLIGYDDKPFHRFRNAVINTKDWLKFKENTVTIVDYVIGEMISVTTDLGKPAPVSRTFLLKNEFRSDTPTKGPAKSFACFLTRLEISNELSEEELGLIS